MATGICLSSGNNQITKHLDKYHGRNNKNKFLPLPTWSNLSNVSNVLIVYAGRMTPARGNGKSVRTQISQLPSYFAVKWNKSVGTWATLFGTSFCRTLRSTRLYICVGVCVAKTKSPTNWVCHASCLKSTCVCVCVCVWVVAPHTTDKPLCVQSCMCILPLLLALVRSFIAVIVVARKPVTVAKRRHTSETPSALLGHVRVACCWW